MKKILAILLVVVMCFGTLVGCNMIPPVSDANIDNAKSYVYNLYKDNAKNPTTDYDVVGKVVVSGTTYTVTWSVDVDSISVVKSVKENYFTIDLPETNAEEIKYTLTATITAPRGATLTQTFERTLPVYENTGVVTAPAEGVAYKLFFEQVTLGQTLFAKNVAVSDNKYIDTTADAKEAADYYVEKAEGGFKIYTTVENVKNYVFAKLVAGDDGYQSKYLGFSTESASVFYYKSDVNAWFVMVDNAEYVVGTYSTYDTVAISESKHISAENSGVTQFPAAFMTKAYAETLTPDDEKPVEIPSNENAVKPVPGTAYNLGMIQGNVSTDDVYYVTGQIANLYYLETKNDVTKGVNFYVEEVTGGYNLYAIVGGAKVYLNMVPNGTHVNGKYESAASTVYTYDETLKTLKTTVNETEYVFGNYGTYTNLGCMKNDGTTFYAQFTVSTNEDQGEIEVPAPVECPLVIGTGYQVVATNVLGSIYFNGKITSDPRFGATQTASEIVLVYFENATNAGEYLLYYYVGDVKTYFVVTDSSKGAASTTEAASATVFEWNTTYTTFVAAADENNRGLAAVSTGNYLTFNTYDAGYSQDTYSWAQFVTPGTEPEEPTDEEKVASVKDTLKLPVSTVWFNTSVVLPTNSVVTLSWESSNADVIAVVDGKLIITHPSEDTSVTITATLTLNDATDTKDFEVKVAAKHTLSETVISAPAADTAYKFYIGQENKGQKLFLDGGVSGRYLSTTTDITKAVDVYAEKVTDGYKLYILVEGVKNYIEIYYNDDENLSVRYHAEATTVFTYDAETFAWTTTFSGTEYYLGTYNTYATISASTKSYITAANTRVSNFVGELVTVTCSHAYSFVCDENCDVCAATRTVTHTWDNACDAICNICSATRTVEDHSDGDTDGYCDKCTADMTAVYQTAVDAAVDAIAVATIVKGNQDATVTVTLPTESADNLVSIAWELVGTVSVASLEGNVLTVTIPATETKFSATATFTYGPATGSKTFEFTARVYTEREIVDMLYALNAGEALEGTYTLTGVISEISYAYNPKYGNLTCTIVVDGMTDKPVECYYLEGTGADIVEVGDTIKVTGTLKNYNGTYEFDRYCDIVSYVLPDATDAEKVTDTIERMNVVTVIEASGSVTLDVAGKRYADVEITWAETTDGGNAATLEGNVVTFTQGASDLTVVLTATIKSGEVEQTKEYTFTIKKPITYVAATTFETGKAYKLVMVNNNGTYYFAGSLSSNKLAATTSATTSFDVYLEAKEGIEGYYIYFKNASGEKYYIDYASSTNFELIKEADLNTDTHKAWVYDTENNAWYYNDSSKRFIGAGAEGSDFRAYASSNITKTDEYVHAYLGVESSD